MSTFHTVPYCFTLTTISTLLILTVLSHVSTFHTVPYCFTITTIYTLLILTVLSHVSTFHTVPYCFTYNFCLTDAACLTVDVCCALPKKISTLSQLKECLFCLHVQIYAYDILANAVYFMFYLFCLFRCFFKYRTANDR